MNEYDSRAWDSIFAREFKNESDRAAVILAATMLERTLRNLLKNRLVRVGGVESANQKNERDPTMAVSWPCQSPYRDEPFSLLDEAVRERRRYGAGKHRSSQIRESRSDSYSACTCFRIRLTPGRFGRMTTNKSFV